MRALNASEVSAVSGGMDDIQPTTVITVKKPYGHLDQSLDGYWAIDSHNKALENVILTAGGVSLNVDLDNLIEDWNESLKADADRRESSENYDFTAEDIAKEYKGFYAMEDGSIWTDTDGDGQPDLHFKPINGDNWADLDMDPNHTFETKM